MITVINIQPIPSSPLPLRVAGVTPRRNRSIPTHWALLVAAILAACAALPISVAKTQAATPTRSTGSASSPQTNSAPATTRPATSQIRGISLQMHSGDAKYPYDRLIREIAGAGANAICLVVPAYQENAGAGHIAMKSGSTLPPARMKELIGLAHELKMQVILMPIVLLENPRENEWRGKIDPTKDKNSWDDWWADYNKLILHYAAVAKDSKVEIFMVGSELVSMEKQTDRWVKLIAAVRAIYGGQLSYSANWDHYKPVTFWDKLDIVGMTSYYDLTLHDSHSKTAPTLADMLHTWKGIKSDILAWQAKIGKPILFTEVAWPNQVTAAKYPWDYYRSPDKPDPQLQKKCFESFFQTWADEPSLAGYLVWEWRSSLDQNTSPKTDTSYCPKDKPAMDVIGQYFGRKAAASTPASSPASASAPATQATAVTARPLDESDRLGQYKQAEFARIERVAKAIPETLSTPEAQANAYYEVTLLYVKMGQPRPEKTIEYAKNALALPLEPIPRATLYAYWGDAIQIMHNGVVGQESVRREALVPYLQGLKELLSYNLPEDKADLPQVVGIAGMNLDLSKPRDRQIQADHDAAHAKYQEVRLQHDLIDARSGLREQIAYMYSELPHASEELRKLASEALKDEAEVNRLMELVQARIDATIKKVGG